MAIYSDAGALVGTWWNQVTQPQARGPITETTVNPAALTARTDLDEAQQALGQPLPIVIGTGRVDGVYFIGGVETVATVTYTTTTDNTIPPGYVAVSGTMGGQTFQFGPGPRTTTTSTTTYDNRTLAGYVLAYDVFERGYNLIRLEIDGAVVFDAENSIPETTTFRFYGGRHTTVDPILTQIIGANPGAYQNFVMIFIEGYPADSAPSISAVISNATESAGSAVAYITGNYTETEFDWDYVAGYDPVDGLIYQLSFTFNTGLPQTYMHVLSVDSLTESYQSIWPLSDDDWGFNENMAVFPGLPCVITSYYDKSTYEPKWGIVNTQAGTLVTSGDPRVSGQVDGIDWLLTMNVSAAFPGKYLAIGNYETVLMGGGIPDALLLVFDAGTETAEIFPVFKAIDYWTFACNGPVTGSDASFFAIRWDTSQGKSRTVMKITYDGSAVTATDVFSWADVMYATGIAYDPVTNRLAIPRQNLAAYNEVNDDGPGTAYDLVFHDASTYALLQTVTLDKRMSQGLRWPGYRTSNRFFPKPGTAFFYHPYYGNIGSSDLQTIYVIDMATYTVGTYTENTDNLANPPELAVLDGTRNIYAVQNWPDEYPYFGVWEVHGVATISPLLIDLQDIITDAMSLAGFGPTDLTFHGIAGRTSYGFVIASDTTVQAIGRSLSDIYGFSWCDTGSGFYFKQAAHGDLFTIDAAFETADIVERDQPVMSQDEANIRTPSAVEMQYVSKEGQYKTRPTSFNMTVGVLNSITTPKFSTPILFNDAEAQRIVQEKFFEFQEKRRSHTLAVAPENIILLPGDIVSFPSGTRTYITRVEEVGIDLRNMGVEISAKDFQTDVASPITAVSNTGPVWLVVRHASGNVTGQTLAVSVGTVTVTAGAAGAGFASVTGQAVTASVGIVAADAVAVNVANATGQAITASAGTATVTTGGGTSVSASVTGQSVTASVDTVTVTIPVVTSYANTGGTGNRRSIIVMTSNLSSQFHYYASQDLESLIDGDTAANAWYWDSGVTAATTGDATPPWLKWDFGSAKVITESKYYVDSSPASSQGTWRWHGSNDDSSYTAIGSTFTFLPTGSAIQTMTSLSANATAYRYYKLQSEPGYVTYNGPAHREIEFKIG